jgi:serine/threonine-protein kinase
MVISDPPGYKLGFQVGSGGMATVCYGRHFAAGGFVYPVAIKQLHPHLASNPEVVAMFLDEARLAARVVHANVVSILDVVQRDQQVWAVMQYIEGASLARLMRQALAGGQPVPLGVAVAVTIDLLAGLEAAHTATDECGEALGIVHRDVSPQNVLVGADGVARVLDFGVAKARGRLHETRNGQIKGKLAYMAPEQLGGEANVSTDIYAAGIVLWELLAGRRLFQADSEIKVMGQVLVGAASAPSAFASVSPALDEVVMRALATSPAQRFASATLFASALVKACPTVATRIEVATWVREIAGPEMAERQRLAVEMARSPAIATTSPVVESVPFLPTVVMPQEHVLPPPAHRSRWAFWIAAVTMGVAGLVAMSAKALSTPEQTASAAPAASTLGPRLNPAASATEPASAPAPEPTTLSVTSPQATAPAARSRQRAAPAKSPTPASTAPTASVISDCDPPFIVEASGMRHYKRHCIR